MNDLDILGTFTKVLLLCPILHGVNNFELRIGGEIDYLPNKIKNITLNLLMFILPSFPSVQAISRKFLLPWYELVVSSYVGVYQNSSDQLILCGFHPVVKIRLFPRCPHQTNSCFISWKKKRTNVLNNVLHRVIPWDFAI